MALQVAMHVHGVARVLYFYHTFLVYRAFRTYCVFIDFVFPIKHGISSRNFLNCSDKLFIPVKSFSSANKLPIVSIHHYLLRSSAFYLVSDSRRHTLPLSPCQSSLSLYFVMVLAH